MHDSDLSSIRLCVTIKKNRIHDYHFHSSHTNIDNKSFEWRMMNVLLLVVEWVSDPMTDMTRTISISIVTHNWHTYISLHPIASLPLSFCTFLSILFLFLFSSINTHTHTVAVEMSCSPDCRRRRQISLLCFPSYWSAAQDLRKVVGILSVTSSKIIVCANFYCQKLDRHKFWFSNRHRLKFTWKRNICLRNNEELKEKEECQPL